MKTLREQIKESLVSRKYSSTDINDLLFEQIKEFILNNYTVNEKYIEIIQGKDMPIVNIKDDIKSSIFKISQIDSLS